MAHELFPFRYRDPLARQWVRARSRLALPVIASLGHRCRFAGRTEERRQSAAASSVQVPAPLPARGERLELRPQRNDSPRIVATEPLLALTFLRGYPTYAVRRELVDQATSTADLWRELATP